MTKKNAYRGFTLIELLVVIAIIGILASIVLSSLNTARAKAADAAIKGDLDSIRKQTELYYNTNGDYGPDAAGCTSGLFTTDTTTVAALAHSTTVSGGSATCVAGDGSSLTGPSASSWAISVPLKTDPTVSWCVDNAGDAEFGIANATSTPNVASCR